MRILHLIGATVAGGAERMAVDLAVGLAASGHEIALFALSGRSDGVGSQLRQQLANAQIHFQSGPVGAVRVGAVIRYAKFLRDIAPDFVHLHTPNTDLIHAIGSKGHKVPVIRTVHSVSVPRSASYRWARWTNNAVMSIACSDAVAEANSDWATPMKVITNGVRFAWPVQTPEGRHAACVRLGLDPSSRHYVMVGSMRGQSLMRAPKAHDVLIEAWRAAGQSIQPAELHFIGDGNLRSELECLAGGDSTVNFHGVSAAVADWLLAADVFVMPSRYEGMPIAAIEALGTGLPCIFSDIQPFRELEPAHARWVPVGDVGALARALASGIGFVPGVSAPEVLRQRFGIDGVVARYLTEYRALAQGSP